VRVPRLSLSAIVLGLLPLLLTSDSFPGVRTAGPAPAAVTVEPVVDDAIPAPSDTGSPGIPVPSTSPSPSASPSPSGKRASTPARPASPQPAPPPAPRPDNLAARLHTLPVATRQVIVAYAPGYGVSAGTLETFQKVNGVWQPVFGKMAMRLGVHGFRDRKVEGDLATPTGMYRVGGTMYGIAGNPGVRYAYHQLVTDDWWNENPASPGYNSFAHGTNPGGSSEPLWQISPQYTYFAVITYNIPVVPATPPRGSGIFLHVSAGHGTAGCLALAQGDLVRVLRWLDPGAAPRIVMAPTQSLGRY
jgi:L,D-peptidoglycan transpeptidase YkuD (ErfK/YbiS/YcfS/YnhG family)